VRDRMLPICRHVVNEREHDNRGICAFKKSAIARLVPEMANSVETHKLGCGEEGFMSCINVRMCLFIICSILVAQTIPKIKDPDVQHDKLANQFTSLVNISVDSIHCKHGSAKLGEGLGRRKDTSPNTCLTCWHPLPGFFCRRITANLVLGMAIA
ncbi:hypothetical protein J3A83DRAFT_4286112, partial [Scleroderma citrinum]